MKIKLYFLAALTAVAIGTLATKFLSSKMQPEVTIIGDINMKDGIGRQAVELAYICLKNQLPVEILTKNVSPQDVPGRVKKVVKKDKKNRLLPKGHIVIYEHTIASKQDVKRRMRGEKKPDQLRMAYSMLESSAIPGEWVEIFNSLFDAVVVPDKYLVEVYKKSGVLCPVFELPLAVKLKDFLQEPLKHKKNDPMVFANFSSCIDRKNHIQLIRAFKKAFGDRRDVLLRINCRSADKEVYDEIKEELSKNPALNVKFTIGKPSRSGYLDLFKNIDCYVNLAKGEGFSIQPREAMAMGIPVIVTNNTAQTTICNSGLAKAVKADRIEPAFFFKEGVPCGYQYNCDVDEAAQALLDVYNNYPKYLEKSKEARSWASFYDYNSDRIIQLYKTLVDPKKLELGAENLIKEDVLITDSFEFYEKYSQIMKERKKKDKS